MTSARVVDYSSEESSDDDNPRRASLPNVQNDNSDDLLHFPGTHPGWAESVDLSQLTLGDGNRHSNNVFPVVATVASNVPSVGGNTLMSVANTTCVTSTAMSSPAPGFVMLPAVIVTPTSRSSRLAGARYQHSGIYGIYAPACGCFYNKHAVLHALGLCKLSRFKAKCKGSKSGGKSKTSLKASSQMELNYTFVDRKHWKIYDFNRTLMKAPKGLELETLKTPDADQSIVPESTKIKSNSLTSSGYGTGSWKRGQMALRDKTIKRSTSRHSLAHGGSAAASAKSRQSTFARFRDTVARSRKVKGQKNKLLAGTCKIGKAGVVVWTIRLRHFQRKIL